MSSFPQHVENIDSLKDLGVDVSDCYENGSVTIESWSYDDQVYIMSDAIEKISQHVERIEKLEAALNNLVHCAEANTGCEPSVSCFYRSIDEAKELLNDKA